MLRLYRSFSTTVRRLNLAPPAELDAQELHVFKKLNAALEPTRLQVQDISGGCGSMYAIEIASSKFKGIPMVKQHRLVNEVIAEEIKTWHGVRLTTKAD
ncbi:Similar to Altered inheritance of mitochondria protein 1; acc. no. P39724 [Pyronema omphalodes CBS 100304]|uniref:Similar to Altered inheritance of mitochondria protein 1 acc. no. P39724 n=1 Tax=Pyronema omphalodes (strain CBS 100304) TaxID=1076935 RepID=U4L5J4_PYROM|nr:Similar to Altered inheritance of mitochondria protein 1; acc. no. P39724 [Pyronema omphalodes CBS 100304]